MNPYNCIIIEDEPIASEILVDYVKDVPFLNLVAVHTNAITALDFLNSNKVDLIFLDIHLPKIKGLDFLKSLKNPPHVILTTAYEEYALKGYELDVLDYLLKPIEFSRFLKAVNKLNEKATSVHPIAQQNQEDSFLELLINKKLVRFNLNDIEYIESSREYVIIHTHDNKVQTKMTISAFEKLLNQQDFVRVHRSFIISKSKVVSVSLTEIELPNTKIPIGRNYREQVKKQWIQLSK